MEDYHTRVFFVVDAPEINEEIFTELELAADEASELEKLGNKVRVRVCLVRHAYYDEQLAGWNYDDLANTFETVKVVEDWRNYI